MDSVMYYSIIKGKEIMPENQLQSRYEILLDLMAHAFDKGVSILDLALLDPAATIILEDIIHRHFSDLTDTMYKHKCWK
jgi:hypothetical protein